MMDTRSKILHAALHLFADYGYDAVGVQTIVEAVDITKPTLYHYFGSKKGLFDTLIREESDGFMHTLQEVAAYRGNITQSINDVVKAYFNYADANPAFYRMLLGMWFAPPESEYFDSVYGLLHQQYLLLEALFYAAANDHGNMKGRHQQYAVSLKGLIDTYIGLALQRDVSLKADELKYRIVHQFMHGIFS